MSGAIRPEWKPYLLNGEEFRSLAATGLDSAKLDESTRDAFLESDLSDRTLVVLFSDEGFPNVNVQICFPNAKPFPVGSGLLEEYRKSGIDAKDAGQVKWDGTSFEVVKATIFGGVDTYQAFVGTDDCTNVATLTTVKGDPTGLADFRKFLSLLYIED